ncbi:hypothetical protein HPB47_002990 [Ixodes persulcatus]|uniref:Uncharacterized protein n=1 Tax=Ixodes persulcatus TaxID=34615 RepID=A0AC60PJQ6_IXOPE|nr:hypothetical protein HPB47_002990 [Ixodes persulcatus]
MEMPSSLVAAMAEPLPPDDEELASVPGSISDDNEGAFQDVVRGTKRRCPSQGSGFSEKTIITKTEPTVGLVVLFTPVDGDVRIDSINSVCLTSTLETLVPSCVIEVLALRICDRALYGSVVELPGFCTAVCEENLEEMGGNAAPANEFELPFSVLTPTERDMVVRTQNSGLALYEGAPDLPPAPRSPPQSDSG